MKREEFLVLVYLGISFFCFLFFSKIHIHQVLPWYYYHLFTSANEQYWHHKSFLDNSQRCCFLVQILVLNNKANFVTRVTEELQECRKGLASSMP